MQVGIHTVGPGERIFIVAEMSANHNGSLERALRIIDAIADTGAQAVKLQTYRADTLTINHDGPAFRVGADHGLWGGRTLHALYEEAHTPWEWHASLFERARQRGIMPFSTPFDLSAVELLEGLGCEAYKIASAEIVDLPLIKMVASTKKPVIISTGMATLGEIEAALTAARDGGARGIILLACTAAYPARPEDARLLSIPVLQQAFGVPVGLSDHTMGIGVAVAAVALGAVTIEKHVTLDRNSGGVDAAFSLDPIQLATLITETDAARLAVAAPRFGPMEAERHTVAIRRSLYVVQDVHRGEPVSRDNVKSIRPAGGLPPVMLDRIVGRAFRSDIRRGTPLTWDLI